MKKKYKRIFVNDHHSLAVAICSILNSQLGIDVIAEAGNGKDTLQLNLLHIDLSINGVRA